MSKIAEYQIVEHRSRGNIEQTVSSLMEFDWQPLGGMCHSSGVYHQAMVKYEKYHVQETTYKGTPISLLNEAERAEYDHEMMGYLSKLTSKGGRL